VTRLQEISDKLIDLSSALLDAARSLKDLVEQKPDNWRGFVTVPQYIQPSMQEIFERREAVLERYPQQCELEHGDDGVFEAGEDGIDAKQKAQSVQINSHLLSHIVQHTDVDMNWLPVLQGKQIISLWKMKLISQQQQQQLALN